jgi:hypothetical protein
MKFYFDAEITVSAYTVVEAESASEALMIAKGRTAELNGDQHEVWAVDESDGEPRNIREME